MCTTMTNHYEDLTPEIINQGKFCLWKYETVSGRKTKVPYQVNGMRADSTNPDNFSSFYKALEVADQYDGIGIGVFEPFIAIDIDHCVENGKLSELASEIAKTFIAYTEYSPSGTGLRIIGTLENYHYDKERYYIHNSKIGLEIYAHGCTNKFVTLTGNRLNHISYGGMRIKPEKLDAILAKYMSRPVKNTVRDVGDVPGSCLSDEEVLKHASSAKNAQKFKELWDGRYAKDVTDESQQEYDLALCSLLAFWCGGDMDQMDRLFRQSGLYREKWERDDYRTATLVKAVTGCNTFYKPQELYMEDNSAYVLEALFGIDPANNARYPGNDLGFGRLYADVFKDTARYVPERKKWYTYDGSRWIPDVGSLKAMELCKSLADALLHYTANLPSSEMKDFWIDMCKKWNNRRYRETYLKEAQSVYPISMEEFDADKYLLNCKNGTLNLKTGEFKNHSPEDKLTKMAPVDYDPYARNGRWDSFIKEVMSDDAEKALFLQKVLGYGISGDTRHECMFFLYGETTRNGKGTLMESILSVLGDYGKATRPETIAQKQNVNSQAPSEDIARLAGIRFANISEPSRGLYLNTAQVKSMTGNDTLNARFLNENSFDFKPQFKLYVNTNYLPVINDLTLFSSGRVIVIPFDRHFEEWEQDKSLKEDFNRPEAKSAILNWLIEGFNLLQEEGMVQPDSVKKAIQEYEYESNKLVQFKDECLIPFTGYRLKAKEVYEAYKTWNEKNGYYAESYKNFMPELRKVGKVNRQRPSDGGEKVTVLEGFKFTREFDYYNC